MVYVIGAAAVWVRFRLVGLPADIAVLHQSRSTVIAVGLRGILTVALGLALLAAVCYAVAGLCWWIYARSRLSPEAQGLEFHKSLLDVLHDRLQRCQPSTLRRAAAAGVVATMIAGAVSWRAFAVVAGGVIAGAATARALRLPDSARQSQFSTLLLISLAAMVAGFSWQITPEIDVPAVYVSPALPNIPVAVPYFGETAKYVYIGVIQPTSSGYSYCNEIRELARDKVLLRFVGAPASFERSDVSPIEIALRVLAGRTVVTPPGPCTS